MKLLLMILALLITNYCLSSEIKTEFLKTTIINSYILNESSRSYYLKNFGTEIVFRKQTRLARQVIRMQIFKKSKFMKLGLFDFKEIIILPDEPKIIFSTFEIDSDLKNEGNLNTNGIYIYNYSTENLVRVTPLPKANYINFYKIFDYQKDYLTYGTVVRDRYLIEDNYKTIKSNQSQLFFKEIIKSLDSQKTKLQLSIP